MFQSELLIIEKKKSMETENEIDFESEGKQLKKGTLRDHLNNKGTSFKFLF